jgi:hypothetical protein
MSKKRALLCKLEKLVVVIEEIVNEVRSLPTIEQDDGADTVYKTCDNCKNKGCKQGLRGQAAICINWKKDD